LRRRSSSPPRDLLSELLLLLLLLCAAAADGSSGGLGAVCVSAGPSALGSATACVSSSTGRLVSLSASLAAAGGARGDAWALDGATQLSDACAGPAAVSVVGDGLVATATTACAALLPGANGSTANVTVVHVVTFSFEAPRATAAGEPSVALRIDSASFFAPAAPNSSAPPPPPTGVGVQSLDSTLQLQLAGANETLLQFIPYGAAAPLGDGGFYAPFAPSVVNGTRFVYGEDKEDLVMGVPLCALQRCDGSGLGLAFALDASADGGPAPPLLVAATLADATGVRLTFSRGGLRLRQAPFAARAFVVVTPPGWRAALGFYAARLPALFEPAPESNFAQLWGASQYADYRGDAAAPPPANASLLRDALGLRVNWDASFMFPFWGAFAGYLDSAQWDDCVAVGDMDVDSGILHPQRHGAPPPGVPAYPGTGGCERNASLALVAQWYAQLRGRLGVASLTYVNPFEFGFALDVPDPAADCAPNNRTAYCVANALFRGRAGLGGGFDAALVGGGDYTTPANWSGSTWLPSPTGWPIAPGVKVLDPAVEPYRSYVVASLQAQLDAGGAAGFCMDRMDHASHFSRSRDDGVAWDKGGPAAWLGYSHLSVAAALRDVAHAAGTAAAVSLLLPRLDLVGGLFDVFLNEHGDSQKTMPLYGLMGLFKPTSGWYWPQHSPPPVELYLRQCLVAGQSPQVPWAAADHGNSPADSPDPTPAFLAYAPLYKLIVGKRWLLSAGAVELAPAAAAAGLWSNAYLTASGLLLPVVDGLGGSAATSASLTTNVGAAVFGPSPVLVAAFALAPGGANISVAARGTGPTSWAFDYVPLVRGTLVLQLVFQGAAV